MDTGTTLKYLLEKLNERHPKTLKVCTMLDEPSPENRRFPCGLHRLAGGRPVHHRLRSRTTDQKSRNLPYISYLQNEGK